MPDCGLMFWAHDGQDRRQVKVGRPKRDRKKVASCRKAARRNRGR